MLKTWEKTNSKRNKENQHDNITYTEETMLKEVKRIDTKDKSKQL